MAMKMLDEKCLTSMSGIMTMMAHTEAYFVDMEDTQKEF